VNPQVVDPLAVLCLFKPEVVTEGLYVKVKIQFKGQRTRGCSIIDYFSPNSKEHNVYLAKSFDVKLIN
jgi:inosine-uridine nucleoside N-ribohydrolase